MENGLKKFKSLKKQSIRANLVIAFLFLILIALCDFYYEPNSEFIRLWFFDVGQGDMEMIETPDSQRIIIDGGPSEGVISKVDKIVPAYDRKIDAVILTHPHADHLVGLIKLFETYEIGDFYFTGVTHTTSEYLELLSIVKQRNISTHIVKSGDYIDLGNEVRLEFLFPFEDLSSKTVENLNNSSVVARLVWGSKSVLYTGDIEDEAQDSLINSGQILKSDILKVPHHGGGSSANDGFIKAVAPNYAIISVGVDNSYGHPSQTCLDLLKNVKIYRTDQDGDILFEMGKNTIKYVGN